MRPPRHRESALRAPLNSLLGTEANVRILRALARADAPLGPGEVARRVALQPSGVRRALDRLIELGIVAPVGAGPRRQVRWRDDHPLASSLRALFDAEAARLERVLDGLRRTATALVPSPDAVWLEGRVAAGLDRPEDPLIVGVVARSGDAEQISERLRDMVAELERREDVTVEFRTRTRAELSALTPAERENLARALSIFGLAPEALMSHPTSSARHRRRTHADQDKRTLALAEAIAAKLATDPGLVTRARKRLTRRIAQASPAEQRELREWDQVLQTMSLARLRRFLTDHGERATRLRQTLPFLDALSPGERKAILARMDQ